MQEGQPAGANYGYHNSNGGTYGGGVSPLWTAGSTGGGGGGMVGSLWYTGANFPAKYKDAYFVGQVRGWNGNLKVFFGKDGGQRENFGPFNLPGGSVSDYKPIDIKMDAAGAIYVSTRFQTEQRTSYGGPNGWWTKGRVIMLWHGGKEPALPGNSAEGRQRALIGMRLAWSTLPGGGLSVRALQAAVKVML